MDDRLIIAVDFGTTYSGIAYCFADQRNSSPIPIDNWPVPAVWSDAAKHATLKAAEMAGLTPVRLIKEPEAAALWTTKKLNVALNSGDVFVVCDAGGGTVDLVSYEVETTSPKLQIKEVVPGTGRMAGSLNLNKRFESAVKELVGDKQWSALHSSKGFQLASSLFEKEIKKAFKGNSDDDCFDDEEFYVNFYPARLVDDPNRGLESNTWTMVKDDLMDIFNPVIDDVLELVDEQVTSVKIKTGGQGPKV
ncbi:hypothetical protein ACHAPE_004746 [Trichoderma viride]